MIEIVEAGLRRGGQELLNGLSLQLPDPGLYLLAGPTGSGKSLLARMLTGRLRPQRGRVELDGLPLYRAIGGSELPLQYLPLGGGVEHDETLAEYLQAEVWRSGGAELSLGAYWDVLEDVIPNARRRLTETLSLGELCLGQAALAAASGARVTALDGQLDYLRGSPARQAVRMLREAALAEDRFILVTSLDAQLELAGATRRFLLEGVPVTVRQIEVEADED